MAIDQIPPDSGIWQAFWWGLGGVATTMGTGFLYLLGQIAKKDDARLAESTRVWTALDNHGRADLLAALEAEKRFATKDDLDRLEARLTETFRAMMREHETNIRAELDRRMALTNGARQQ